MVSSVDAKVAIPSARAAGDASACPDPATRKIVDAASGIAKGCGFIKGVGLVFSGVGLVGLVVMCFRAMTASAASGWASLFPFLAIVLCPIPLVLVFRQLQEAFADMATQGRMFTDGQPKRLRSIAL